MVGVRFEWVGIFGENFGTPEREYSGGIQGGYGVRSVALVEG